VVNVTAELLPPILRDERGIAFGGAADFAYSLNPWLACPLKVEHSSDEVLWELARQFDVAGPLYQAMKTRAQKERLIRNAIILQRKRGTPWSVEEVMRLLGYTDAEVIDRISALKYDGTAVHNGKYNFETSFNKIYLRYNGKIVHDGIEIFDGYIDLPFENWRGYKIRLYMAEDSRPFADFDREQATVMAEDWAPLRSVLAGFFARHLIFTQHPEPAYEAARVYNVYLLDSKGNRELAHNIWVEHFESGARAVRWRVQPDDLGLPNVSGVILTDRRDRELYAKRGLPMVSAAENVTYEGVWHMDKEAVDG